MITKILVILMMAVAFFLGAFIAKATSAELPKDMAFLSDLPVLAEGVCTEKATNKNYFCEYKIDAETGNSYLVVWNETELYEVVKNDTAGNIETIYKAVKKLKL